MTFTYHTSSKPVKQWKVQRATEVTACEVCDVSCHAPGTILFVFFRRSHGGISFSITITIIASSLKVSFLHVHFSHFVLSYEYNMYVQSVYGSVTHGAPILFSMFTRRHIIRYIIALNFQFFKNKIHIYIHVFVAEPGVSCFVTYMYSIRRAVTHGVRLFHFNLMHRFSSTRSTSCGCGTRRRCAGGFTSLSRMRTGSMREGSLASGA